MTRMRKRILLQIPILCFAILLPMTALAQIGSVRERQVRNLISRIESRTDSFRREVQYSLDRTPLTTTAREDRIMDFITDFENATDGMRRNFDSRRGISAELNEVLNRAVFINRFMARNRLSARAESDWMMIRTDLDTLARIYTVSWDWNRSDDWNRSPGDWNRAPGYGMGGRRGFDGRLTGTYRLNRSMSDNVTVVLDRWDDQYSTVQRDRMRRNLERRLTSPEMIAIEKAGRTVTIASSLSPQVTFEADGIARTETTARGRTLRTTARANRETVEISYLGDRSNDFFLTLASTPNGQLRVTRRLYLEGRNQTVSVSSVYDKIDNVARWSVVNNGGTSWPDDRNASTGDFYVPDGTRLTAVLNNTVTTRVSQIGDRFTMRVTSPGQYRDAIIEGRVARVDNSGRLSGRANISMEFDSLRLPTGETYRFAGVVESVRTVDGDNVSVTNEGTIRDRNQTTRTVTRAGIGAALGALIGAIAGGGDGAAIGAAVGAGAGAGSVLIQGRDNVELEQGSEFRIMATAPARIGVNRY